MAGMTDFRRLLDEYKNLLVAATALGVLPLVTSFTSIAPGWPSGIASITTVIQLVVLILVYQFIITSPKRVFDILIASSFVVFLVAAFCYVLLLLNFTFDLDGNNTRIIRGFSCTKIAHNQYSELCPFLDKEQLRLVEYEPSRLWTTPSINAVRAALFIFWVLTFMALTLVVGSFVAFQKRNDDRRNRIQQP
jgi:hypothetical protein